DLSSRPRFPGVRPVYAVHGSRGCDLSTPFTLDNCPLLAGTPKNLDNQRIGELAEPGLARPEGLKPVERASQPRGQGPDAGHAPGDVAVTYDQSATDGVGSQLQRIYALYALSRALDIKYVHSPIGHVGYQGFVPLLTGRTAPD